MISNPPYINRLPSNGIGFWSGCILGSAIMACQPASRTALDGHYFLKKYVLATIFALAFTIPLFFIFSGIISKAQYIAEQLNNGQIPLDSVAIIAAATNAMTELVGQELNFNMYMLIIIWFLAIFDAYRISKISSTK